MITPLSTWFRRPTDKRVVARPETVAQSDMNMRYARDLLLPGVIQNAMDIRGADKSIVVDLSYNQADQVILLVDRNTGRESVLYTAEEVRVRKFGDRSDFYMRLRAFMCPRASWRDWTRADITRAKKPRRRKSKAK